jgi:hypothetical protein
MDAHRSKVILEELKQQHKLQVEELKARHKATVEFNKVIQEISKRYYKSQKNSSNFDAKYFDKVKDRFNRESNFILNQYNKNLNLRLKI